MQSWTSARRNSSVCYRNLLRLLDRNGSTAAECLVGKSDRALGRGAGTFEPHRGCQKNYCRVSPRDGYWKLLQVLHDPWQALVVNKAAVAYVVEVKAICCKHGVSFLNWGICQNVYLANQNMPWEAALPSLAACIQEHAHLMRSSGRPLRLLIR